MQKLSEALTVAAGVNCFKPTATVSPKEVDILLEDCSDLINPDFKSWYCKRFASLGREQVAMFASQARADGREPKKLFSFLVRK